MFIFLIVPALIAGAASIGGGWLANRSARQESARDRTFQSGEAATSRAFAGEQAARQMRFQERMRNTEWQAGIADMEAAGLNPAIAYGRGGATSPAGASASGAAGSGSRANQQDYITPGVSSTLQYKRTTAEIAAIKAGINKTKAETEAVRGRPGRILEPAVSAGTMSMRDLFSERTLGILNYEAGSSAKQVFEATKRAVQRLKAQVGRAVRGAATIGPNLTRRRR